MPQEERNMQTMSLDAGAQSLSVRIVCEAVSFKDAQVGMLIKMRPEGGGISERDLYTGTIRRLETIWRFPDLGLPVFLYRRHAQMW